MNCTVCNRDISELQAKDLVSHDGGFAHKEEVEELIEFNKLDHTELLKVKKDDRVDRPIRVDPTRPRGNVLRGRNVLTGIPEEMEFVYERVPDIIGEKAGNIYIKKDLNSEFIWVRHVLDFQFDIITPLPTQIFLLERRNPIDQIDFGERTEINLELKVAVVTSTSVYNLLGQHDIDQLNYFVNEETELVFKNLRVLLVQTTMDYIQIRYKAEMTCEAG